MSFLETNNVKQKERFSLLLLEPGETYFEDFSAFYYPTDLSQEEAIKRKQRGRLKISSKSVVFDPKDVKYPILKFAFRDITLVDRWVGPLLSRIDSQNKMILIDSEQLTEMMADNDIAPYVFIKMKKQYLFALVHQNVSECVQSMCQLQRAATLPLSDQKAMINAIVSFRQNRIKFDTSWLDDLHEKLMIEAQADRITPLVKNPGRVMLTSSRLYFQPFNNVEPFPVLKIRLTDVRRLIKRRYLLKQIGLEIYCEETCVVSHLYLNLATEEQRDTLYDSIVALPDLMLYDLGQENMTMRWQNGFLSNFDYLQYVNSLADRSSNDLTQYPVFPWVLADYNSSVLDLKDPSTFRDLSKPIGALNAERLERLRMRYDEMPEPRFLYGSHYSSPAYVLFYLARIAPECTLCLHNGRFDQADRMFNSVAEAWHNCQTSYSDFMELIPQFYEGDGRFLCNSMHVDFGKRQDGRKVTDVLLPPWATDAADFVRKMREGLESAYVSEHLHQWIDLIFGYKQRGLAAEEADNVFYYLTYEGSIDLESIEDANEREALEAQISEFGQTPKQIFFRPHPQRNSQPTWGATSPPDAGVVATPPQREQRMAPPSELQVRFWGDLQKLHISSEHELHKDGVCAVKWSRDGKSLFSVSQDTCLKVYCLENQSQSRSISFSSMPLSCVAVLPDGKTAIVGSWDNNVYIYSVEYGRTLKTIQAHDDAVSSICLRGDLLVSASWDSTVKLWQCGFSKKQSQAHATIMADLDHDTSVTCCDLNDGGSLVVSGTKGGTISVWDVTSCYRTLQIHAHSGSVNTVLFSPDSQKLLSCGDDAFVKVIDIQTGTEIFSKSAGQCLNCAGWDGETVLVGTGAGNLLLCDLISSRMESIAQAHTGSVNCFDISRDGIMATGGAEKTVKLWKTTV